MGGQVPGGGPVHTAYQAWRAKWRWPVRAVFLILVTGVFVFVAGFIVFAEHISRMRTPVLAQKSDGIIVLTGGQARIAAATSLLKAHKGDRLLISGVNPVAAKGNLAATLGVERELFDCCVDIDMATSTISNAEESAKWITARGYDDVILVTNNYHMPRSLMEMRRYADGVTLHPYPVVNTDLGDGSWLRRPQAVRVLFTEYTKFLAAASRTVFPGNGATVSAASTASIK